MTHIKELFTELNTQICGQVKFSDGSITKIEGQCSILFTCKSGEHRTLTGVYYIPRLRTNILSHLVFRPKLSAFLYVCQDQVLHIK
jgi:hypothetical protein